MADRTQELEQRSSYLVAAAEVGRTAASILEADALVQQVVELIRKDFGLYYVGLFQVDDSGEWAELRAGTGEAGWTMLARGHRLHIGGDSMIGWSITNRQPRIALEAGEDAVRLATPELPETRSEAALPLQSRGRVMGALSVQHTRPGAFDEDTIVVLQTMADQVAVALDNARLFAGRQEALEAVQRAYGEVSSEAWHEMLRSGLGWAFAATRGYYGCLRHLAARDGAGSAGMGASVQGDGEDQAMEGSRWRCPSRSVARLLGCWILTNPPGQGRGRQRKWACWKRLWSNWTWHWRAPGCTKMPNAARRVRRRSAG